MDGCGAAEPAGRRGGSRLALSRGDGRGQCGLGGTGTGPGVLRAVPEDAEPRGGSGADRGARQGNSPDPGEQDGAETGGACVGDQGGSGSQTSDAAVQSGARLFGGGTRGQASGDGDAEGGDRRGRPGEGHRSGERTRTGPGRAGGGGDHAVEV